MVKVKNIDASPTPIRALFDQIALQAILYFKNEALLRQANGDRCSTSIKLSAAIDDIAMEIRGAVARRLRRMAAESGRRGEFTLN